MHTRIILLVIINLSVGIAFAQMQKIFTPIQQPFQWFGYHVGISNDIALIFLNSPKNGKSYIYKKTNKNNWEKQQEIEIFPDGLLKNPYAVFPLAYDTLFGIFKYTANFLNRNAIDYIKTFEKLALYSYYFSDNWLIFRLYDLLYNPYNPYNPLSTKICDYFYRFENDKFIFYNAFEQIIPFEVLKHYYGQSYRVTNNSDIAVFSFMTFNNDNDTYFGKIEIYRFNGEHWLKSQEIFEPGVPKEDSDLGFHFSLSPDGNYLAACTEFGDVYVYKNENDQFRIHQNIPIPDEPARRTLKITNDELLIGNTSLSSNPLQGIRFYKLIDNVWVKQRDIHPPSGDLTYKFFGETIDRDGETVIAGAPLDTKYGLSSGAAYIFQIPARDTITVSVCKNEGYSFEDTTYYESGTYRDTLIASYGVDSVVVLNLTVLPVYNSHLDTILCEGQSVQIGDQVFDKSGQYNVKLISSVGCDSTIDLTLKIIDREYPPIDTFFCSGNSISLQGQNISSAGTYSFTLKNINGCDSIVSYNVTRIDPDKIIIDTSFCEGQTLTIRDKVISEPGTYSFDLKNLFGCDSIVSFIVAELPVKQTNIDTLICEGESISIAGNVLNQQGQYNFTLVSSSGCDSLITLDLKIAIKNNQAIDTILCDGQSIMIGNQIIEDQGNYSITLVNQFGCDSIINIKVEKSELEVTEEILSDLGCRSGRIELELDGNNPPFQYRWNTGSTGKDLVELEKGKYTVVISDKTGCSYEFTYQVNNSVAYLIPEVFVPDGTEELNKIFRVFMTDKEREIPRVKILSSGIFDRWGEKVFSSTGSNFWDGTFRGKPAPAGVYLYSIAIESPCGVKTLKGQVLLLR